MSTIEAIVLRRVVLNRASLTGGALALHNYQMGMARSDSEIIFRDDIGSFHYFKSDAKNELKYSQLGHIHDDRYYTETEIDDIISSLAISHKTLSDLQGGTTNEYYHLNASEYDHASKLALNWDMNSGTQQPVTDNAVDIGYNGATPKRVRAVYSMDLYAATGIYRGGLELASVFAPISHASNGTTYGIASSSNYGHAKSSTTNPLMDGTADPGTAGALFANYNHRHPSDTTKKDNLVYSWERGYIASSSGWAKIISLTLPNSTTTTCNWFFNIIRIGTVAGTNSRIGKLRIQWRNGTLSAEFTRLAGSDSSNFGYTGTLAPNSLFEVYAYCATYPYLKLEVEDSYDGVIAGGTFSTTDPGMTGIDAITVQGQEYNDLRYALLSGAAFTGNVTSTGDIYASGVVSSGSDMSCVKDMGVGRNFSVTGFSDLRGAVKLTGLTISTSNADAVISASASGFINTATYTANRTVELPVPEKGKILTLSNRGSSTVYGMVLQPASGTTIHYGITPTLTGGNTSGIKSMILEGVSSTNWAVMSMWSL